MSDPVDRYDLPFESNKYQRRWVEAVPPTRRDIWAILRGHYKPKVRRVSRITLAGMNRVLKRTWTGKRMAQQMQEASPLLEHLKGPGVYGIKRRPDLTE